MEFTITFAPPLQEPVKPVLKLTVEHLQAQAREILLELATYRPQAVPFIEFMPWYDEYSVPIISLTDVNRLAFILYTQHWGNLLASYPLCYLEALRDYFEVLEEYEVCARLHHDITEWVDFNAGFKA